jgi:hypothetical protein
MSLSILALIASRMRLMREVVGLLGHGYGEDRRRQDR